MNTEIPNVAYLKWIKSNPEIFDQSMKKRHEDIRSGRILELYSNWTRAKQACEKINAELNSLNASKMSSSEGVIMRENRKQDAVNAKYEEQEARKALCLTTNLLPNILDTDVPEGESSVDNLVTEECGTVKKGDFLHHENIAIKMGCWGREQATQLSGSRFLILRGELATLERALFQFAIDYLLSEGFEELSVPLIVNKNSMFKSGQLPKFEKEMVFMVEDKCLIPTGEVPLVNFFAGENLPSTKKVLTYTQCFRREAGSLGKDTKGMVRLHQFGKVEMVCITKADESHKMHMEMLGHSKKLLDLLKLPYKVVDVCGGDIGFTAGRQFDIEVWMPGQGKYVEVASCSNCFDFQARRAGIKCEGDFFAHTLNATAISGRVLAAILENFYIEEELTVPIVLKKYMPNSKLSFA